MNEEITEYEQEVMDYFESLMKEQKYPNDYGGDDFWDDDGWLLTVSWNPTQTKQEEIAFAILDAYLTKIDSDNHDVVRFRHWACGYVMQMNTRPILDGRLTKAGEEIYQYIQDNGYDYLIQALEEPNYIEWEREMVVMCIDNDDLTDEQTERLVSHLLYECDVHVDGDGYVHFHSGDLNELIEEETDYLFGNSIRAIQRRAAEHPDQTKLFTTQEE